MPDGPVPLKLRALFVQLSTPSEIEDIGVAIRRVEGLAEAETILPRRINVCDEWFAEPLGRRVSAKPSAGTSAGGRVG